MSAADARPGYDLALVFSTKYEPPNPLLKDWPAWDRIKMRFFDYHHDVPPSCGGPDSGRRDRLQRNTQGTMGGCHRNAANYRSPQYSLTAHQVTGVCLHNQPDRLPRLQMKSITSRQSKMYFHFDSAIHFGNDDNVALRQQTSFCPQ